MNACRWTAVRLCAGMMLAGIALVSAQQLPSEPAKRFGASITGAFEGWFDNPDGSHSFLVGYLNRNRGQATDIPIGPNNRIEPGGPDQNQPTHFLPGRHEGIFIVTVPKAFARPQQLTWTITANGQTTTVPLRLTLDYNISPLKETSRGDTPPTLRFEERGPAIQGPLAKLATAASRTTSVSTPLPLTIWAEDDGTYSTGNGAPLREVPPPVRYEWAKYRGPGTVTFTEVKLETIKGGKVDEAFSGKGSTTAKFSEPGEYVLHVTAKDFSGGGELCCWSTALVKVTVTP